MNKSTFEANEQNFAVDVIEKSKEVPVVVDFWADWCGPCRSLGPILERLADEANGLWVLAKVDVDANPGLAQAFGIQGIPAVRGWRDGKEIAEFVGALPEPQVRKWLEQLGPTQSEITLMEAEEALSEGRDERAQELLREVLRDEPGNAQAKTLLERLEMSERAGTVDESEVRARLESNPSDPDAAIQLADLLASRGDLQEAFSILIDVVRDSADDERERVRTHLLKLLDTIPADDPRAMKARRELSLVLF